MYNAYWQLEYAGGLIRTEPPEGETILHAPRGYTGLRICDKYGKPLIRIDIPSGARAVFYRKRSLDMGPNARKGINLDATVFGWGRGDEDRNDGKLWMWNGSTGVNVPERFIDPAAIDHLLMSPVGV